jgi:hypothetical protein
LPAVFPAIRLWVSPSIGSAQHHVKRQLMNLI